MKNDENSVYPCISEELGSDCCTNKTAATFKMYSSPVDKSLSYLEHIKPTSKKLMNIICKYEFNDLIVSVFCINAWRTNRSALAQALSLNMAVSQCRKFGSKRISNYAELSAFYTEVSPLLAITPYEDWIIDDFGEVYVNHADVSYPIITGTGHQQVYAAMRFMTTLASAVGKEAELYTLLNYVEQIIHSLKGTNILNEKSEIVFEMPTEEFWNSVKTLFCDDQFQNTFATASSIMGYQNCPIEMQHFVNHEGKYYPLYNSSILVDYYKCLLLTSSEKECTQHIIHTILSFIENTYNFNNNDRTRILIHPHIGDREASRPTIVNSCIFTAYDNKRLLIALDNDGFDSEEHMQSEINKIKQLHIENKLRIIEGVHRKELGGGYGIDIDDNAQVIFMLVSQFTDITEQAFFLGERDEEFKCTALDAFLLLGFAESIGEIIDFIIYDRAETAKVVTFGGKSSLFFAWKNANYNIASGAIEFTHIHVHYDTADSYVFSHFADNLKEFPRNKCGLFFEPLSWSANANLNGYTHIEHKGCKGFGGEIKYLGNQAYVFLAHNIEFFSKEDFEHSAHTALKTIDDLNQRLFDRYSKQLSKNSLLKGKILQLLFMPWHHAKEKIGDSC